MKRNPIPIYRLTLTLCVAALLLVSVAYLRETRRVQRLENLLALTAQAEGENAAYIEWLEENLSHYEAGRELWRDYVWALRTKK